MKNTGLALGGGAVLGAAHIGTLKAVDELDIEINCIAGTSIGALIAAFYAFGKSWEQIQEVAKQLKWMDITALSLSRFGLLSNQKIADLLTEHIGDKNIEDAEIPLAIIATDITKGEKVILKKGSLAQAVMASTCIPGIFNPVEINDKMLIDGGVVENVPISTIHEMGADYIIGVNLNAKHTYDKPANILDVILNSFHYLMQQADKLQSEDADLLITPDLSDFNRANMEQVADLINKGYEDSINALKNRKLKL